MVATFEEAVDACLANVRQVLMDRRKKYGSENINRHGLSGLVVRLDDKLARLGHSLTDHPDETCYDTLVDVVGYGIIGLMWIHNWWGLPLGDDNRPD